MNHSYFTPHENAVSITITGSGGSGAVTAGLVLLESVARAGLYGLMGRSVGPQIRGGESAAMVRFSSQPVDCPGDRFDLLVALDWRNVLRFVDEIPLDERSLIIADPAAGDVPEALTQSGAQLLTLPIKEIASGVKGGRINMVALGAVGAVCALPPDAMTESAAHTLAPKGDAVVAAATECILKGYDSVAEGRSFAAAPRPERARARWNISGNEASGLGALRGGVRFVAAYPITPATEILEWLAPRLEQLDGTLLQAEDELASVNMIIGASFGGVPALTTTSGPGLSLMMEGLGLAVASEIPAVVVNVMRGGPSTGIPTKSEQADLNIAIYGFHGDAPHLVLAPLSITDCIATTQWGVGLAERLQTVAIVLTDQSLGQARAVIDPPEMPLFTLSRQLADQPTDPYLRYRVTAEAVSPVTAPGTADGIYTGDGLEHNERGAPSSIAADHLAQLEKRQRKLEGFDYGKRWAEIEGEGDICLLTWGSSAGVVFEAANRLRAQGQTVRVLAVRLLAPLRTQILREAIGTAQRVLVVEQNHQAQFFHYLNAQQALPPSAESYARPGPLPIRPGEIVDLVQQGGDV